MKRLLSLLISFALLMLSIPCALAQNEIRITVDGKELYSDQPPIIKNDRVFVPVRVIAESLGATVDFKEDYDKRVYISDQNHTSEFAIGYAFCLIDGLELAMDTKPFIENGRTLLPVRIVSQALGCLVLWDNDTKTVNIKKTEYDESKYDDLKIYPDKPLVYDAFNDEVPFYYSPHYVLYRAYSIPALNINHEGAKAVSKAIYDHCKEYVDYARNGDYGYFGCHYSHYLYDGILSVVMYSLFENDFDTYNVFNYDIESGKALTNDDILSRYNIDSYRLNSIVKDNYIAHIKSRYDNLELYGDFELYRYALAYVAERDLISTDIFIDNNGYIRAVVSSYQDDDGEFTVDTGIKVDN